MAQSTPINSYCPRASFGCAYMHHIEKYVFQQESVAPGLGLLLGGVVVVAVLAGVAYMLCKPAAEAKDGPGPGPVPQGQVEQQLNNNF